MPIDVLADQSVLGRVQDSITERKLEQKQETQAFESKLGTLPLPIDEPDFDPADEGNGGDADSDDAWKNTAASIYIQNKILSQVYDSNLILVFTHLPAVVWTIVLGPVWGRDPLETLGDAAMQIVLTELVVDWAEALDLAASRKIALRHAILGPLQSNATFMAVLQTKWIFRLDSETIPKYPGDALEVFAGSVAKFVSLDALKLWVAPTFEPIISESVKAWDSYSEMSEKHGAKIKVERTRPVLEDTPEGVDRRPTNKPRCNEPQWAGAGNLFTRSTRATPVNPETFLSSSSTPDLITPPTTRTAIPSIVYSFRLPAEPDLAWIPEEVPSSFEDTIDKHIVFEPLWPILYYSKKEIDGQELPGDEFHSKFLFLNVTARHRLTEIPIGNHCAFELVQQQHFTLNPTFTSRVTVWPLVAQSH
ncbi:hypothetical protein B0H16DRAFT_1899311 [Mycena metata]|uniref:Uncharacterized protein n=1 Tax=Mycena metata TaxID=1033252 RepID=A0AAD7H785_9AGAR|nr:hypothetical protein B0H16DRAFT_1899311 [Mycena metata]